MTAPLETPDRTIRHEPLVCAIVGQCRGATALVTPDPEAWAPAFEGAKRSVEVMSPGALEGVSRHYRTVVVLEGLSASGEDGLLRAAWERISDGGRLVVVAPNAAALPGDRPEGAFTRRELRKKLRAFGKVRLIKEQPFRWLAMNVLKCDEGQRELSDDKRERYRVSAGLCRGRVLELGCGRGHLVHHAAELGCEVLGVDHSAAKIAEARERYPELEFLVADILELELPEAPYDTVLLPEILEHVDDETGARMLERAWNWVAPGGRLVVSVPNEDCIPHPHHIRWFDAETLSGQLKAFGRPHLMADQPYKWLLMYVERPVDGTS